MRSMDDFEVVPIGIDCSVSHFSREIGLRSNAYPFDWNITPIESAILLLENQFEGFLDEDHLVFLPPAKRMLFDESGVSLKITEEMITPVVCKKYNMLFPHDFTDKGRIDLPVVREKYNRRIARLHDLLVSTRNVLFVYSDAPLNDWQLEQFALANVDHDFSSHAGLETIKQRLQKVSPGSGLCSVSELKQTIAEPRWHHRLVQRFHRLLGIKNKELNY